MDDLTGGFREFLSRNVIPKGGILPLVHSTPSLHLPLIANSSKILPRRCDVFQAEDLSYFFVGRPAYKNEGDSEASDWELPTCFIFEYSSISPIKRIFPFDSGAFSSRLYPNYISMMERDKFEVSSVSESPSRIIGAYFGTPTDYFRGEPRSIKEFKSSFDVNLLQAQALAVHRLATEKGASKFDDRRLTIEVQHSNVVDLTVTRPLAVIAPSSYFDIPDILDTVQNTWGAQPLTYGVNSLNVNQYYNSIYDLTSEFYKELGLI